MKLVEREKSALEAAKKEADGFLKDQNELVHRQSELYQVYEMLYRENIAVATQSVVSRIAAHQMLKRVLKRLADTMTIALAWQLGHGFQATPD